MAFPLETDDKASGDRNEAGRMRWRVWIFAPLVAGLLVYAGSWAFLGKRAAGQGPPAVRSTPVVATAARPGDVHIYLTGLGTVTALYTATILTQVTGQVLEVPFKEGDIVKKGALLAQVDPRPFEAVLIQAQGQLARDKALLEEAKTDFKRFDILAKQDSIALQQRDDQIIPGASVGGNGQAG